MGVCEEHQAEAEDNTPTGKWGPDCDDPNCALCSSYPPPSYPPPKEATKKDVDRYAAKKAAFAMTYDPAPQAPIYDYSTYLMPNSVGMPVTLSGTSNSATIQSTASDYMIDGRASWTRAKYDTVVDELQVALKKSQGKRKDLLRAIGELKEYIHEKRISAEYNIEKYAGEFSDRERLMMAEIAGTLADMVEHCDAAMEENS
jgi:hypothetical protein